MSTTTDKANAPPMACPFAAGAGSGPKPDAETLRAMHAHLSLPADALAASTASSEDAETATAHAEASSVDKDEHQEGQEDDDEDPTTITTTLEVEDDGTAPPARPARVPSPMRAIYRDQMERRSSLRPSGSGGASSPAQRGLVSSPSGGVHFGTDTTIPAPTTTTAAPAASQEMKHIDRDRLYTDIEYRFEYMCSFLDFGASDKALIVAAAPLLADQIPTIVDNVYGKLLKYDILAASFMHRMQNYDGEVIRDLSQLNVNSEQIKFRRSMLKRYLVCAMLGVNDMATLLQYLEWVSLIHTRNTSKHSSINVEYIHLGAMLSYIDLSIHAALTRLELPADTLTRTQAAFTKMFALQNDLFALYYTHDGLDLPGHPAHKHGVFRPVTPIDREKKRREALMLAGAGTVAVAVGVVVGWLAFGGDSK